MEKAQKKLQEQIAHCPLFQDLPRQQQEDLARIVEVRRFLRRQMIFSEGSEGNGFYVLISGRVKIFKLSPEGKEQILHILGPGETFGEVPVFAGEHFPANAEALGESRAFFFPRPAFINLIRRNPFLALNMLAVLSRRLRRFAALIEDLSLKEVPGRLAAYFLFLGERKKGGKKVDELEKADSGHHQKFTLIFQAIKQLIEKKDEPPTARKPIKTILLSGKMIL